MRRALRLMAIIGVLLIGFYSLHSILGGRALSSTELEEISRNMSSWFEVPFGDSLSILAYHDRYIMIINDHERMMIFHKSRGGLRCNFPDGAIKACDISAAAFAINLPVWFVEDLVQHASTNGHYLTYLLLEEYCKELWIFTSRTRGYVYSPSVPPSVGSFRGELSQHDVTGWFLWKGKLSGNR